MSLNDIGYVNSRVQTDLAANEIFSDTDTDLNVVSTSRFQAPCAVLIGHRDAWHDPTITYAPEIIWVTEVPSGTVLRTTLANRGQSGTAVRTHDNAAGNLVATLIFDQRNWEQIAAELDQRGSFAFGTYSGDGTEGRLIALPFGPRCVWVQSSPPRAYGWNTSGQRGSARSGWYRDEADLLIRNTNADARRPALWPEGFRVNKATGDAQIGLNESGYDYYYTALG